MSESIAVIGAGSWGTAVANVLADQKHKVFLWARDPRVVAGITKKHENLKYLKGHALNPALTATSDLEAALQEATYIVNAIPTQKIRSVFLPVKKLLQKKPIINTAKGIEIGTNSRVSEIFLEIALSSPYLVLSGPSFAEEVIKRLPTAVTLASHDEKLAKKVQKMFASPYFRTYRSSDVVGVELAGALKNVIAIAAGVVTGLNLGYNATAATINRGMAEMARLGHAQKASLLTFLGLAGMGDLVLTCTGPLSRNRQLGVALGKGDTAESAQKKLGGVAEGFFTAQSVRRLSERYKVEMPISEEVSRILSGKETASQALSNLMGRDLKEEWPVAP